MAEDEIVCANEAGTDDVDQAAAEQVMPQQNLTFPTLEAAEIDLLAAELHLTRLDARDTLRRHEHLPSTDPRLQPGDRRVAAIGKPHDQVVDAADLLPSRIDQTAVQDRREVQERNVHSPEE
ncbi:MAG TPA: hypothetical protein VN770_09880 [Gaiellaceae bacterium]|nr:hypothetical protein [Gaiellaceae bacterium]